MPGVVSTFGLQLLRNSRSMAGLHRLGSPDTRMTSALLSMPGGPPVQKPTKKGPVGGPLENHQSCLAEQGEIGGGFLAVAADFDLIGHLVVFIQALQARTLNGRNMDEGILAAAFWRDEAEALGGVEEFNSASNDSHARSPLRGRRRGG